jgi:ubiquinone/menaquinone biosynthesis C-methylase UbiE
MPGQDVELQAPDARAAKPYKGMAMEGLIARWYTKNREHDPELEPLVRQVRELLPPGSQVLEVAPGPGYLSIELARGGQYQVVGLDISASFVQIAQTKAREAGATVNFQQGNAARMPFAANVFDLVICRAAFKNFTEPVQAIQEMHRVLKPHGTALIIDLRGDATLEHIREAVDRMGLNAVNRQITLWTFRYFLLKNAYTSAQIRQMVAGTPFVDCEIREDLVGMKVWLKK